MQHDSQVIRQQNDEYNQIINSSQLQTLVSHKKTEDNNKVIAYHYVYAEQPQFMLGSGSYGRVYVCYFESRDYLVKLAVKIVEIPNKIEAVRVIEKVVATTREEIKALIKLVHNPNIIKIEDVITDEREKNKIFLILEYCDNKDLTKYFQRLREQHLLTKEEQVIDYFCQILQGFEEMSRLNIIHYDIKPQNILVSGKTLKIADFGLSRQFFEENETLYENHVGTECTKAPQIKFKESYTSKCDIYSLGVTLYWMFYGKYPFEDNASRNEIKAGPQFDSDAAMKLSPETKYLLKQMLAFSEDDRITWKQLCSHSLFLRDSQQVHHDVRATKIDRGIYRELRDSNGLNTVVPLQMGRFIDRNNYSALTTHASECFELIQKTVLNEQFLVNFYKLLLDQLYVIEADEKAHNKAEFKLIRDLIRRGIEHQIFIKLTVLRSEITENTNTGRLIDVENIEAVKHLSVYNDLRNEIDQRFNSFVNSTNRPKLSVEELVTLPMRCKEWQVHNEFKAILNFGSDRAILAELERTIVQFVYFIKPQIKKSAEKAKSLPQLQQRRYRSLVLLVHHLFMFLMQKQIFPPQYDADICSIEKFDKEEKYAEKQRFDKLVDNVIDIIDRFE